MKPPLTAELLWSKDLQFGATSGSAAIVVDGHSADGPSPMQLLAFALAGCMSADVVSILQKGRHTLNGFRTSLRGERAEEPPRRFLRVTLEFHIIGEPPSDAVERAIELSRDKYCSVWQSMARDIELVTTYTIAPFTPGKVEGVAPKKVDR